MHIVISLLRTVAFCDTRFYKLCHVCDNRFDKLCHVLSYLKLKKKKTVLPKKKKLCMYMKAGMFFDNYLKKGSKCVKK